MQGIRFVRSVEKAGFFSPLAGMDYAEQAIEVRRDPLTGATAVTSSELATKEEMFFGKTDWAYADELAARTRDGCFFCPERVFEATPRYPEELLPGGRLQRGAALVFPNLFPLAALHAVITYPDRHSLRPTDFTPELVEEGLAAAVEFVGRAEAFYPGLRHVQVCCNHMLPAGASLVHPHYQVFGGETAPRLVEVMWQRAEEFMRAQGVSYWRALVEEETARGERLIATRAGCSWLTPFAPAGGREVMAVLPAVQRISALDGQQVKALAHGLSNVLAWYEREALSAFNFTIYQAPLGADGTAHAVILRVMARTAFKQDYRTDDYFLQKQLGSELIFVPPEEMAAALREDFGR